MEARRIEFWYHGVVRKRGSVMAVVMQSGQAVMVQAEVLDAKSLPAPIDGLLSWVVDNPTLLTVSPSPDSRAAHVAARQGETGSAKITVSADADLGPSVRVISATLDFVVSAANLAVEIVLTPGEPY